MAFSTTGSSENSGFSFQINVTPLIDVLLVMLIIFMVIVPVMPHGLAAALPSTGRSSIVGATPDQPIMVQVELRSSRVLYRMNGVRVDKGQIGPAHAGAVVTAGDTTNAFDRGCGSGLRSRRRSDRRRADCWSR
jgi:biopolymer transport protein TolR